MERQDFRKTLLREFQRMADRVCVLILSSDLPAVDIEIEKNKVRQRCLERPRDERGPSEVSEREQVERIASLDSGGRTTNRGTSLA